MIYLIEIQRPGSLGPRRRNKDLLPPSPLHDCTVYHLNPPSPSQQKPQEQERGKRVLTFNNSRGVVMRRVSRKRLGIL